MWGYIDKEGHVVCDFNLDAASFFTYGRAEIVYHSNVFNINTEGQCVKSCRNFPSIIKFHFYE